ncbi:MAG: rod shape-determining protein MreC, partial [Candidatus Acidiferrales bacterium]
MDAPSRHRPLVLLVAVILAQVLLLAFQIKRGRDVRLIRVWSAEVLTPPQRAGTFAISKINGAWFGYIDLRHARKENQRLADEVGRLRLANHQLEGQAAEAGRLARLLGFRQANSNVPMLGAEVIGASADSNSQTIFINRGEHDGIRRNMAVVTPDGVIGKIFEAFPHTSQVLLITDKESGVGALLANTRTHGVVKGTAGPLLWMDYVSTEEKVPAGEEILTSGEDKIFPKDLPVGSVASTKTGFPFQAIQIEPAAHLDRLEEVLVLLTEQSLNPTQAGG